MRFKLWLEQYNIKTLDQALNALELTNQDLNLKDIQHAWRQLSKVNHPDVGGSVEKQSLINQARDFLIDYISKNRIVSKENPEWQTDRGNYVNNQVGKDFRDLNYCKKKIWEESVKNGPVEIWNFNTWDGYYFRCSLMAFSNKETLGYAALVTEKWCRHYTNIAVFGNLEGSRELYLLRSYGKDNSGDNISFEHDSFNFNPGNDLSFVKEMRTKFPESRLDVIG